MDQMTSKERLICAIEGKPVDRIPFSPFLAYVWEHFPADVQDRGILGFLHDVGADPLWRGAPCPANMKCDGVSVESFEENGRTVSVTTTPVGSIRLAAQRSEMGNTLFLVEHPLKSEEDFKVQLWIEEHSEIGRQDPQPIHDHVNLDGLALGMLVPRGKTAFQSLVEHHVGTEELIYALCDYPDAVESLHAAMVANDLKAAAISAESEYDYFITWEDSSTQNYSPSMYDKYIAPEICRFCSILGTSGKSYVQHACGHVKDLVVKMRECGVKAVESISPPPTGNVSIADAREAVGSSMGIIGGIEPTYFLNLSMEALEGYVEEVIHAGSGGPFILANSDSCPPGVTVEKFKLVADVARRTGG